MGAFISGWTFNDGEPVGWRGPRRNAWRRPTHDAEGKPVLRIEEQVLFRRLVAGQTITDAAREMGVKPVTAHAQARQVRLRLGVETTAEAIAKVIELKLLGDE